MNFNAISIEKVKKFWDSRPCNIRHSKAKIGSRTYFDEVERRKYFVEPHISQFADFKKWKGKKVLEIGCGIGTDTINFAREGAKVTAVDISPKSLHIASTRATVFGLTKSIDFIEANAEELSKKIDPRPFDLVYSFGVIHHTPHPEKVIEEMRKFMHKKTVLKLMVYHKFSWKVLWILFHHGKGAFWKINALVAKHSEGATGSPVTYVYSKRDIMHLLANFQLEEVSVEHIFPYVINEYTNYVYKMVWYFRILPKPFFRFLERRFGWHMLITARPL